MVERDGVAGQVEGSADPLGAREREGALPLSRGDDGAPAWHPGDSQRPGTSDHDMLLRLAQRQEAVAVDHEQAVAPACPSLNGRGSARVNVDLAAVVSH